MRWLACCLSLFFLLAISACDTPAPTAPEELSAARHTSPGHSGGRIVVGGQIREGPWKISFAGHANTRTDGSAYGAFHARFHSVSIPAISGRTFVATDILGLGFAPSDNPDACIGRSNWVMVGTLDGEPGYRARILAADAGKIGGDAFDDFRIIIYTDEEPPVALYLSSSLDPERPGGDFPAVSNCAGGARARVDAGQVKIWMPD